MADNNFKQRPNMSGKRHGGPGRPVEKPKDFKGTIKKVYRYLSGYHTAIIFVILFAAGSTIFNVIGPRLLGMATTEVFNGAVRKLNGTGAVDMGKIFLRFFITVVA